MDTTTAEKIAAIESSDLQIAFNDCHKIYLVDCPEGVTQMAEMGYSIYPANLIREIIGRSCPLVFVSDWNLGRHPWEIDQCTEDIYEAAKQR